MHYELNIGSFFFGLLILAVGIAFMRWHQVVANNLGSGVVSFERYKLVALVTCLLGFIVMLNLHTLILVWILSFFIQGL